MTFRVIGDRSKHLRHQGRSSHRVPERMRCRPTATATYLAGNICSYSGRTSTSLRCASGNCRSTGEREDLVIYRKIPPFSVLICPSVCFAAFHCRHSACCFDPVSRRVCRQYARSSIRDSKQACRLLVPLQSSNTWCSWSNWTSICASDNPIGKFALLSTSLATIIDPQFKLLRLHCLSSPCAQTVLSQVQLRRIITSKMLCARSGISFEGLKGSRRFSC